MYIPFIKNQGRLFQYLATFSGTFSVITSGINLGWTSPYLPQLLAPTSPIPTTSDAGSWCAIMPLVGAPVGAFIAAILGDVVGRKNTSLLMAPIILLSFIGMAFAPSILLLSVLRFIIGATEGALYTVLPMYIGEISDPQIRGFLTSMVAIAGIAGTLFINIIGQTYSIFTSSLICAFVPVIHFLTFVWMPESPYYYIKKKKFENARESLKILTGRGDVDEEMEELCTAVERQEENKGKITDLFTVRGNRRACFIFVIVCVTNKFSGKNPCLFYTTMIFEEAGSNFSSEMSVIIYCAVELVVTLVATFVVDRCGKRPLFILSTLGCSLSVLILGTYFYLKNFEIPHFTESWGWVPITSLVAYNILFSVGLGFATVTVISELFPTNVKTVAAGIADSFSVSMGAIASKFFQITNDEFGMFVPFWAFGACCIVGLVLIVKFVPETKGKSLEEIQFYLNGGNGKEKRTCVNK
ncbi:facilitated trehalose transporter Tret1-like [Zophobas morio]|uniref:facilitated trehalose transporter Tret1-like n=1 Tax=Zophobas morio TaxID=2755281 RepID=UPI00308350BA